MTRARPWALLALPLGLAACEGRQSVLDPAGTGAETVYGLWSFYLTLGTAIYGLVLAALLGGIVVARRRRQREGATDLPILHPDPAAERRRTRVVATCVALTAVVLFVLLVVDFNTGRALYSPPAATPLQVKVTAHQWWWEVEYQDPNGPFKNVVTANELHVPLHTPVRLQLESPDVIHSFWVPNLTPKKDLVPGHAVLTWLMATRSGSYMGQCAEFCGLQHAKMRLSVVAEPRAQFVRWLAAQQKPAPAPTTASERLGQQVFVNGPCLLCHTIQGTPAMGRVGPNLTHVASRPLLGAYAPNTRGNLAGWILNPHSLKPGVRMPPTPLAPQDLNALLDYLESLK